jgi:hypothetical protein
MKRVIQMKADLVGRSTSRVMRILAMKSSITSLYISLPNWFSQHESPCWRSVLNMKNTKIPSEASFRKMLLGNTEMVEYFIEGV